MAKPLWPRKKCTWLRNPIEHTVELSMQITIILWPRKRAFGHQLKINSLKMPQMSSKARRMILHRQLKLVKLEETTKIRYLHHTCNLRECWMRDREWQRRSVGYKLRKHNHRWKLVMIHHNWPKRLKKLPKLRKARKKDPSHLLQAAAPPHRPHLAQTQNPKKPLRRHLRNMARKSE